MNKANNNKKWDDDEVQRNYMLGQAVGLENASYKAMDMAVAFFKGGNDTVSQSFRILSKELKEMSDKIRPEKD